MRVASRFISKRRENIRQLVLGTSIFGRFDVRTHVTRNNGIRRWPWQPLSPGDVRDASRQARISFGVAPARTPCRLLLAHPSCDGDWRESDGARTFEIWSLLSSEPRAENKIHHIFRQRKILVQ